MSKKALIGTVFVALAAAGVGYLLQTYSLRANRLPEPAIAHDMLPSGVVLNDLTGQSHSLDDWSGKLLLINFWASWCGPCLDEMPELVKAQQKYGAAGLQIIGPAVDDPEAAQNTQAQLHISYPVLVGSPQLLLGLMKQLGNDQGGLPFTVLVAPDGHIIKRQLGQLSGAEIDALISANLPPPAAAASAAASGSS